MALGAPRLFPPILDGQIDPGLLNGSKVVGVAGYQRNLQAHGDGGNQAVGQFYNRALLARRCLDGAGGKVVALLGVICSFWLSHARAFFN